MSTELFLSHASLLAPVSWVTDSNHFDTLLGSPNHHDLIRRRWRWRWRCHYRFHGPRTRPRGWRLFGGLLVHRTRAVKLGDFASFGFFDGLIAAVSEDQLNAALVIGQRQCFGLFRRREQRHGGGWDGIASLVRLNHSS